MIAPLWLSVLGAVAIAWGSAAFGVGMARMFWAEDLTNARQLDEIRSQTETQLRAQIAILQQKPR